MKKVLISLFIAFTAMTLFTGCIGVSLGGGTKTTVVSATVGQQLLDLKKAKDAGAITDAEYQEQKVKILASK
jgi:hypothetical protein